MKRVIMADIESAYSQGPKTWNAAFPPICLKTHWDPTAISHRVLPGHMQQTQQQNLGLALDPRPASMICKQYYTTSAGDGSLASYPVMEQMEIPLALRGGTQRTDAAVSQVAFPPGGAAARGFPYKSYNPVAESDILRLREHLTRCAEKRYIPHGSTPPPDVSTNNVPGADQDQHMAANIVQTSTNCRADDDAVAWNRSSRLFFNPTRYDRTTDIPPTLKQAESKFALRC
jgi:hypothetical protein